MEIYFGQLDLTVSAVLRFEERFKNRPLCLRSIKRITDYLLNNGDSFNREFNISWYVDKFINLFNLLTPVIARRPVYDKNKL